MLRIFVDAGAVNGSNILVKVFSAIMPILIALSYYYNPLYYIFFESIWQRTPGKWATGTKVVKLDGTKPGFWRIVGRTFARWIPFDWVSFLFGEHPFGWHDRISGTMVVPASYTLEESSTINPREKGKVHGVSIVIGLVIGLFFLIAVIGILSGIVLAALGSAREKGQDVALISTLSSARLDMELYAANANTYVGACSDAAVQSDLEKVADVQCAADYDGPCPSSAVFIPVCNATTTEWAISVPVKSAGAYCVDSSEQPVSHTATPLTSETSCTALPPYQGR